MRKRKLSWKSTLFVSAMLGMFGIDRVLMGHIGLAFLKLITIGGMTIWWIADMVIIATQQDVNGVEWI